MSGEMSLQEAFRSILGTKVADDMTADMGEHWTLVAAMSAAKTNDDPRALAAIRRHNASARGQS